MQFLWLYIDDLVGKGLPWSDISKLLFYASAQFVPMALPIAVLLSSVMTFGNLGEKYELVAIKSAGVSLRKSMLPLFFFILLVSAGSFLFSNYAKPYANLKAGVLSYDIRKQKPALNIKEGMFYNGLEGFSIKIDHKAENGVDLEGLMIYDHNSKHGNDKVIVAEKGKMYLSENEQYFIIALQNGYSYYEMDASTRRNQKGKKRPHQRSHFKDDILRFDLSGFGLKRSSEDLYRNHYAMMNNNQLSSAIDSIYKKGTVKEIELQKQLRKRMAKDTTLLDSSRNKPPALATLNTNQKRRIYTNAINSARSNKSLTENNNKDLKYRKTLIAKHEVEWHRKLTLAFACIVMFMIGAPLGAIIRKGGFGMPVIVSVGFFVIYHVVSVTGEKMVKEAGTAAYEGMWLANLVLLPIGIWLSYKATTDSSLFDLSYYTSPIKRFFNPSKQ